MRRKIVAGNWKMNKNLQESVALAGEIKAALDGCPLCGVEVVVAPVFTNLYAVAQELKGTPVAVAAQNIYPKPNGAYTGEVSAPIAKSAGASDTPNAANTSAKRTNSSLKKWMPYWPKTWK